MDRERWKSREVNNMTTALDKHRHYRCNQRCLTVLVFQRGFSSSRLKKEALGKAFQRFALESRVANATLDGVSID